MSEERTLAVVIPGVIGVEVFIHISEHGWIGHRTNADGYVKFDGVSAYLGDSDVRITANGYQPYLEHFTWHHLPKDAGLPQPLNQQIMVGVDLPPLQPLALPRLHVEGLGFVTTNGDPWRMAFADSFRAYDRFLRGEDLRPVFEELRDMKANGIRVLGMADSFMHLYPQEHQDFYARLPAFCALATEYRLYVQFCVFADTKIIMPWTSGWSHPLVAQIEHFARVCNALRDSSNVLIQLVNENDSNQNGIELGAFAKPVGILSSIGSNGTGNDPPLPAWDYSDLGSERRGDFSLSCTTVHFAIHGYSSDEGSFAGTQRATVVSEPPGFAEEMVPGRRTNDPAVAYLMGLGCQWGAGGCAHSDAGIQSVLLPPRQKACVEAFIRGVQAR